MKITSVKQGSTAEKLGVKSVDQLLRINSKRVKDEIDFRFKVTEEDILLEFQIFYLFEMEYQELNNNHFFQDQKYISHWRLYKI